MLLLVFTALAFTTTLDRATPDVLAYCICQEQRGKVRVGGEASLATENSKPRKIVQEDFAQLMKASSNYSRMRSMS